MIFVCLKIIEKNRIIHYLFYVIPTIKENFKKVLEVDNFAYLNVYLIENDKGVIVLLKNSEIFISEIIAVPFWITVKKLYPLRENKAVEKDLVDYSKVDLRIVTFMNLILTFLKIFSI